MGFFISPEPVEHESYTIELEPLIDLVVGDHIKFKSFGREWTGKVIGVHPKDGEHFLTISTSERILVLKYTQMRHVVRKRWQKEPERLRRWLLHRF